MTWEIFIGIAALSAFIIPIMTVVVKVTRTLTLIQSGLTQLSEKLSHEESANQKSHDAIDSRLSRLEKRAVHQENQIAPLERM